jgi:hypothetical protein
MKAVAIPGRKIEDIFKEVRTQVKNATSGRQIPWEATSLEVDFYFFPPVQPVTPVTAGMPNKSTGGSKIKSADKAKKCEQLFMKISLGMEGLNFEEQQLLKKECR